MKTIKYSRFLDLMQIQGGEPLLAWRVYVKMSEIHETGGVWHKIRQWMTFGDIFSEINLDFLIVDVIILTNLIFLVSKFGVPTLNIIWSFVNAHDINEMSKIVTKQKDLNFDRSKTLRKSTISFNFRIIDGHIEIPYCMLLFDKSNKQSIKLQTVVTWIKSNLNIMNIYQESTINFWICRNYEGSKYGLCITHVVWHDCLSPFSSHSKVDRKGKGHVLVLWFLSSLFGTGPTWRCGIVWSFT
jgi:hypothetical protein